MAEHTPGPWEYGNKDDGFNLSALCTIHNVPTLATEDGKGQQYAHVSARKKCFEISADENEANGRLIAAAPDLLKALHRLYDLCTLGASEDAFCNGVTDSSGTIDEGDVRASDYLRDARVAIAKAEGRS